MLIKRELNLTELLNKKSFFLFGPRATGKSSLIKQQIEKSVPVINLLRSDFLLPLSANPSKLEEIILSYDNASLCVIDEVQKIPALLNEVHRLIEERHIKFLLTGSSARSLRQKHVNLLAGRAWEAQLFPFASSELQDFNLERYLRYGGLPPVYLSNDPDEELNAYVMTYLKEEIQAESLIRKIPAFTRFLQVAAITSGNILNFSSIANDTSIPASTIREYYHILEDTFIGFMVSAWQKSVKRKAISTSKFYLFDLGVKNTLAAIEHIDSRSDLFGQSFEHFIALELRAYISYRRLRKTLCYWQTQYGNEVDFIIGDECAVEVKACEQVQDKHLKGLKLLAEEGIVKHYYLVSQDKVQRKVGQIQVIYWRDFLVKLWQNKII